ncbi:hypothetical protein [Thalassobacillus hwangdonensis]|uniref:Uncharacterized protein n=1 Tax=Thalassobacillus hwangdonensis TaxID=546108 RepID=A0ABW3L0T1_9BACI
MEITCISKVFDHYKNSITGVELIRTNKNGETSPLVPESGATLTVGESGFLITVNETEEIIARGLETDVFEAVRSVSLTFKPLIVDDGKERMLFDQYDDLYGGAADGRTNRRKFVASVTITENETAFGIVEYNQGETVDKHTIYIPETITNQNAFKHLADYVYDLLEAKDYGILEIKGVELKTGYLTRYKGVVRYRKAKSSAKLSEAEKLVESTLRVNKELINTKPN